MKHIIITIAALTSLTATAQIGSQAIIKQRARDAATENNNRGVDPQAPKPATPAKPAAPTVTATPLTASQQAFANFQTQLLGVNSNTATILKPTLVKDMASVAQGVNKPSAATLTKLSDHLTAALAQSKLTRVQKTRLAQNIGVLLNSANSSATQKLTMIKDVQSILEAGGVSSENTTVIATDLQTVTEEVKVPAKQ
jgi:hypothetical protein